jgi:hypothetical protein
MIGITRKSQGNVVAEKKAYILRHRSLLDIAGSRSPSGYWNGAADDGIRARAKGREGNGKARAAGRFNDHRAPVNAAPLEKYAVSRMERRGIDAVDGPGTVFRHIVNGGLDREDYGKESNKEVFHCNKYTMYSAHANTQKSLLFFGTKNHAFFIGKKIKNYGNNIILCLYLEPKSGHFYRKKKIKNMAQNPFYAYIVSYVWSRLVYISV